MIKNFFKLSLAGSLFLPINSVADIQKNNEIFSENIQKKIEILKNSKNLEFEKLKNELSSLNQDIDNYIKIIFAINDNLFNIIKNNTSFNLGIIFGVLAKDTENITQILNRISSKDIKKFPKENQKKIISLIKTQTNKLNSIKNNIQYFIDMAGKMIQAQSFFNVIKNIEDKDTKNFLTNLKISDFWFSIDEESEVLYLISENKNFLEENIELAFEIEEKLYNIYLNMNNLTQKISDTIGLKQAIQKNNKSSYSFDNTFEKAFSQVNFL